METLTRFMVIRAPQLAHPDEARHVRIASDPGASELVAALSRLNATGDRRAMNALADEYVASSEFRRALESVPDAVARLMTSVEGRAATAAIDEVLATWQEAINAEPVDQKAMEQGSRLLGDALVAAHLATVPPPQSRLLARALRFLRLAELLLSGSVETSADAQRTLNAIIVLPASIFPAPPLTEPPSGARRDVQPYGSQVVEQPAIARVSGVESAIADLLGAYEFDLSRPSASTPERGEIGTSGGDGQLAIGGVASEPQALSAAARQRLQPATKKLLRERGVTLSEVRVASLVTRLEEELASASAEMYAGIGATTKVLVGGKPVSPGNLVATLGGYASTHPGLCPPSEDTSQPPGVPSEIPQGPGDLQAVSIGDLLTVEQQLVGYVPGDIAHIENVLSGEFKERIHKRTRTVEDSTVLETELIEEETQDLASTERFEMSREVNSLVAEDTSLEAGLTVSGRYGFAKFTANTDFARDSAREEATRTATSTSRDVTERASSRIQERTLRRITQTVIQEFMEKNLHRLDNSSTSDGHISGVYRWVDKVYRAQVLNRGRRMMLELMIPEPGAFLRAVLTNKPLDETGLQEPEPPGFCVEDEREFQPLQPSHLSPSNYLFWAGKYKVTDIDPPPPRFKIVATAADAQNLGLSGTAKSEEKLKVPDGYRAKRALLAGNRGGTPTAEWRVYVGRHEATNFNFAVSLDDEDDVVPFAVVTLDVEMYAFTLEVECERTVDAYRGWQLGTYQTIMSAYENQLAGYHDQLASLRAQQGVSIRGRNPLLNRQLIDAELKKSAISVLTHQHFNAFDAMGTDANHTYPEIDLARLPIEGPFIRFFEQAIEWENMIYLLYPYYWGRKSTWMAKAVLDDADPLFGEFLRSGAARVVIPVRPTFESAIISYLSSGWPLPAEGGEAPPDDAAMPLLSIADEIKASQKYDGQTGPGTIDVSNGSTVVQGTGTDFTVEDDNRIIYIRGARYKIAQIVDAENIELETPYLGATTTGVSYSLGPQYVGAPWEVRVPTSLVHLQAEPGLGGTSG